MLRQWPILSLLLTFIAVLCYEAAGQTASSGITVLGSRWYPFKFSKPVGLITAEQKPGPGIPTDKTVVYQDSTIFNKQYFFYETIVRNDSGRSTLSIAWHHVFFDKDTGDEVGRIPLGFSDKKIGKGKTQQLTKARTSPPTKTIDANNPKQDLLQRIEIKCVIFDDGSSWRASGVTVDQCADPKGKKRGYFN